MARVDFVRDEFAPLALLLWLTGCGLSAAAPTFAPTSTPRPVGTAIPRPTVVGGVPFGPAIDPARIANDPTAHAGYPVSLRGVASGIRQGGDATRFALAALRPNRTTVPLAVELIPPRELAEGTCYAVYGVVAGGGARPALVYGYRADVVAEAC